MTSAKLRRSWLKDSARRSRPLFPTTNIPASHRSGESSRDREFLLREPSLKLDWLQNLSGIDYVADDKMCVEYDLWSFDHRHGFAIKAYCPRDNPLVPSVADLWPAADWQEREAYDMFGIVFERHPDLRRILCADDWEGYPLRKDYVFPRNTTVFPAA